MEKQIEKPLKLKWNLGVDVITAHKACWGTRKF